MAEETKWYFGSRRVFAFPQLGIVVKVPRFYWKRGLARFLEWYRHKGVLYSLHWTEDQLGGCRQLWTKGVRDNWKEFLFFWRYRKSFLQPTLFSFFGLINIQLYGKILSEEEFEGAKIWRQFYDLMHGEHLKDSHHFDGGRNFCVVNGRLRMVDYGSPKTRGILLKWADAMYEKISLEPTEQQ